MKNTLATLALAATIAMPATDAEAGWFSRRRSTYQPVPAKQTYEPTPSRTYNSTQSRTPRKLTVAEEYQAQRATPQEAAKAPEQPTYSRDKNETPLDQEEMENVWARIFQGIFQEAKK